MRPSSLVFGATLALASTDMIQAAPLNLPPGAVVIYSGSAPLHRLGHRASARRSTPDATDTPAGDGGPTELKLPPGAIMISAALQPARRTPPRTTATSLPAPPADVAQAILASAARHGVSPALIEAVAWQESRFDPTQVSLKGARGVMQLMPSTAIELGVDASDLHQNIDGGAAYLAALLRRFSGDLRLTLAAYNAGPAAVERRRGVPPYAETQAYVAAILRRLEP